MTPESFTTLIATVTQRIAGKPLDRALGAELNETFPPDGETFRAITAACRAAIKEGWMCNREGGGIKYGRVVKPGAATHGFSVDVVDMRDLAGPHHRHPNGEIDMIESPKRSIGIIFRSSLSSGFSRMPVSRGTDGP